jgi:hypothetical protein
MDVFNEKEILNFIFDVFWELPKLPKDFYKKKTIGTA